MIHLQNFSKGYGGHTIVSAPDLRFDAGLYWIKGENGSGKTTFFKSLAGLHPCQGTVSFGDGIDLHKHPVAYRKRVNYSEAEPVYPGFLTSKDLFAFVGEAKSATAAQRQYLVDAFGIDAYYDKPCETYSSGMLKKLSLALAFLGEPSLIILDEPLITLDEAARSVLFTLIVQKIQQQHTTFLLSSHQMLEPGLLPLNGTLVIVNKTLTMQ